MFCPKCGTQNDDNNHRCTSCGSLLHDPEPKDTYTSDSGLETFIPYRNRAGLIAYYLGVFSLIPVIGIPLGIAGVVLGVKGLKYADEHPEAKGKAHAAVGVGAGGLFALLWTGLLIALIAA